MNRILITGGASGLGRSITESLSNTQNELIITYNRSKDEAGKLERKFNLTAIQCDFNSLESVENLINRIEELDIDILVNNAFTGFERQYFHKIKDSDFLNSFTKDVLPVIKITSAAIKVFRKKKFGKIITILSSSIINKPPIGWSTYTAGKAYLLSMNKSWAIENGKYNISSNAISPSFMETDLNKDVDSRIVENMALSHPLKRLLEPGEVSHAVKYLTEASQQINGINLIVNAAVDVI